MTDRASTIATYLDAPQPPSRTYVANGVVVERPAVALDVDRVSRLLAAGFIR